MYDREIWGPTAAQKRYEGRKDLGNTQKGDGKKFMGRTAGQITGRRNTTKFYHWCMKLAGELGVVVPNFVEDPDKMNTDPWEGLGPLWYWDEGNPEGQSLNKYAKDNNIEMVTRRINGGTNGLGDRMDYYVRCALVLLGYSPEVDGIKKFQSDRKMKYVDGVAGSITRQELHMALGGKNPFREVVKVEKPKAVTVPEPVIPKEVSKPWYKSPEQVVTTITGPAGLTLFGWFNDISIQKMLVLLLIAAAVIGGFFLIKRRAKTQVKNETAIINAEADYTKQTIRDDRATAEAFIKSEEA